MSNFWPKIIGNIQKLLSVCSYGEISVTFVVHSGSINKIFINHTAKYMDISEVPDVSI